MSPLSPPFRSHLAASAPWLGMLVCAAFAAAQGDVPEIYIDPRPPGPQGGIGPSLVEQPWPETPTAPFESPPLPESDSAPETIYVPDPLALAEGPLWGEDVLSSGRRRQRFPIFHPLRWIWTTRHHGPDQGIGYERVSMAPFVLDIAQPMNQTAVRTDLAYGWGLPDRSEALWARTVTGRGPKLPEASVSYQDIGYLTEVGTPGFSVRTLVPLRMLNPEINGNTAGMGDMQLLTKTVMFRGGKWTVTQVNDMWFNTGAAGKGLGTGHISIAPGMLATYQWSDLTCLHAQGKFQFPIAGDPQFAGEILHWGFGLSHLLYDSDTLAVIPTVEAVFSSLLTGQATLYPTGLTRNVDSETMSTLHLGLRTVHDTGGACGLIEFGVSGGLELGAAGWYDGLVRMEFRVLY